MIDVPAWRIGPPESTASAGTGRMTKAQGLLILPFLIRLRVIFKHPWLVYSQNPHDGPGQPVQFPKGCRIGMNHLIRASSRKQPQEVDPPHRARI